jgi:hypothetical protein
LFPDRICLYEIDPSGPEPAPAPGAAPVRRVKFATAVLEPVGRDAFTIKVPGPVLLSLGAATSGMELLILPTLSCAILVSSVLFVCSRDVHCTYVGHGG